MSMRKVTIFQSLNDISTPFNVDILEVFDRIKTGKKSRDTVESIRSSQAESEIDQLKNSLPVVCFSGDIYKISEDSVNSHTGFICLYFDEYSSDSDLEDAKKSISEDEHVMAVFRSVSGFGLKVVIKIPPSIENHRKSFMALMKYFSDDHFDSDCYNVSSVCYESYDPDIYINPDSTVWEILYEEEDEEDDDCEDEQEEDRVQTQPTYRKFWIIGEKGGLSLNHYVFRDFLVDNGYYKYYPNGSKNFIFVRKISNRVSNITEQYIKDFVLGYIDDHIGDERLWNFFADKTKFFKEDFLSFLPEIKIEFVKDTPDCSYIFYQNVVVKATKSMIQQIKYEDLHGWVWEDQMIDRNYQKSKSDDCDFKVFVKNISGNEPDRIKSVESTIGFLIHNYKDPSYCPAVILNDETISDKPEGGTGKGILGQGISKIRKMVVIDGKKFDHKSSFPYQTVQQDTQILTFDDAKYNFDFESLFSLITEGITLEKKNKDAIKLPFSDSPKILLNTNYALKGGGNSHDRRKWDLEFKQHYNRHLTPMDEFKRRLFDDWTEPEWKKFDNYMLNCLQLYLKKGFIKSKLGNLKTRRFISETSKSFYEWITQNDLTYSQPNVRIYLNQAIVEFKNENPDYADNSRFKISHQRFALWMKTFGLYKYGLEPAEGRAADGKWIQFREKKKENPQKKMNL